MLESWFFLSAGGAFGGWYGGTGLPVTVSSSLSSSVPDVSDSSSSEPPDELPDSSLEDCLRYGAGSFLTCGGGASFFGSTSFLA